MNGATYERELVNRLTKMGYAVMRSPASGAGTSRDQPDLLASMATPTGPNVLVVEAKAKASGHIYIKEAEVDALQSFADSAGANARLAGRWRGDTNWYLRDPEECYTTDEGNYRLSPPDSAEEWSGTVFVPVEGGDDSC